jgi:proline iminopeptidase
MVEVEGASLWTCSQGAGQAAVVLVHGGPGLWDMLEPVAAMLDDLCVVHRFDQRGCGRSKGGGPYTIARAIADLEALRQQWGHRSWIVGGHSWGADLVLLYALEYPGKVDAVLYMSGTGPTSEWRKAFKEREYAGLSASAVARLKELNQLPAATREGDESLRREHLRLQWSADLADPERTELLDQIPLDGLFVNYEANRQLGAEGRAIQESQALVHRLPGLNVPVLVVHGAKDRRPVTAAQQIAQLVPHSNLFVLEDAGHLPWLDQPDRLRERLRRFIRHVIDSRKRGG